MGERIRAGMLATLMVTSVFAGPVAAVPGTGDDGNGNAPGGAERESSTSFELPLREDR